MMRAVLILCLLAACNRTSAKSTVAQAPGGEPYYEIHCGHESDCYEEANRLCGGPYEILSRGSESDGAEAVATRAGPVVLVKSRTRRSYALNIDCAE